MFEEQINFLRQRARSMEASGQSKASVVHAHCAVHLAEIMYIMRPMIFDVIDKNKKNKDNAADEQTIAAISNLMNVSCSLASNIVASAIGSIAENRLIQLMLGVKSLDMFSECLRRQLARDHDEILQIDYDQNGNPKPFDFRKQMKS